MSQAKLEVGKTYKTKFQTGEDVLIHEIIYEIKNDIEVIKSLKVIYLNSPDLGPCPLNPDRIIQESNSPVLKRDIYSELRTFGLTHSQCSDMIEFIDNLPIIIYGNNIHVTIKDGYITIKNK